MDNFAYSDEAEVGSSESGYTARAGQQQAIHYFSSTANRESPRLVCSASGSAAVFVMARLVDYLYKLQAEQGASSTGALAIATDASQLGLPGREELRKIRSHARYCLSLRADDECVERLPQVCLDAADDDERSTACLFGLSAVIERVDSGDSMQLGDDWYGEQFVVKLGLAGRLDLEYCNTVFQSLLAFLTRTGLINLNEDLGIEDDLNFFGPDQIVQRDATQSGLFVCRHSPGKWVNRGEYMGSIYCSASGSELVQVTAPANGLVTALRRTPEVSAGDLLLEVCER